MRKPPKLRSLLLACAVACAALFAACAASDRDQSEREWQRAECNRIIDQEARERCLKRL